VDGVLAAEGGAPFRPQALEADASGRLLALGDLPGAGPGVWRFLADGTLDTTFAGNGVAAWLGALPGDTALQPVQERVEFASSGTRFAVGVGIFAQEAAAPFVPRAGTFLSAIDAAADADAVGVQVDLGDRIDRQERLLLALAFTPDGTGIVAGGVTREARHRRIRFTPYVVRVATALAEPLPQPDLTVAYSAPIQTLDFGGLVEITVHLRVANAGPVRSAGCDTLVYLSQDGVLDASDRFIGQVPVGPVEPGSDVLADSTFFVDTTPPELPLPGQRVIAVVNGNRRILESDASNDTVVSPPVE
jgi:hypothetical protein